MRCYLCNARLFDNEVYSEPPECNKCKRAIEETLTEDSFIEKGKVFEEECRRQINLDFYNECWD